MITINMEKAKTIAHNIRRSQRAKEFDPYDNIIAKQIPGQSAQAEQKRQEIRDKYAVAQVNIDSSTTPEELKSVLDSL